MARPGGGGAESAAALNSKTINDNKIKFGGVVENHKLISLVSLNCHMTSSLRPNDVITQNLEFLKKSR